SLGLLAFCALLVEGAIGDWSAVYLRDSLGTSAAIAAMGFAAFSLAMALGRLAGDALARRLGGPRLLRVSGSLAAVGLSVALVVGQPSIAVLGFGLVGLGMANLIPVLFSAAGRTGAHAGTAIAAVATAGYLGYLAGPPLIGLAADAAGLPPAPRLRSPPRAAPPAPLCARGAPRARPGGVCGAGGLTRRAGHLAPPAWSDALLASRAVPPRGSRAAGSRAVSTGGVPGVHGPLREYYVVVE